MSNALEYNKNVNEKLNLICKPLLDYLGLSHFMYLNLLSKNKRLYLCTDITWVKKYINHKFYEDSKHENYVIAAEEKPECTYWSSYGKDNVFEAKRQHNMSNGFVIFEGNEVFSFCTNNEKTNIIYSYIQHYDVLKHFILYFKCAARDFIQPGDLKKTIPTTPLTSPSVSIPASNKKKLLKEMKISKFYIDSKDIHASLSKRELEYLIHLASGKSSKEIAAALGIACCTAETHMEHIKNKLGCFSKTQVIDTFFKSNLKYLTPENSRYILNKNE